MPIKYNTMGYRVFTALNYLFLVLLAVVTVFPYLNVLAQSFNNGIDTARGGLTIYPRVFTLDNFKIIVNDLSIRRAALVTVARVLLGTSLNLFFTFTAAYAFTRKNMRGRSAMYVFLIIPMFFGGGLIPYYVLLSKIHLLNKFWVYIIPTMFGFFNMIIMRTYIYTISENLVESAKLDGATDFRILGQLILPLSKPIIATIGLWQMVSNWNDWVTTLYFVTKPSLYTLQYMLEQLIREQSRINDMIQQAIKSGAGTSNMAVVALTPESVKSAQVIITTIPIIMVYPFLQKYFIKGALIGALKD